MQLLQKSQEDLLSLKSQIRQERIIDKNTSIYNYELSTDKDERVEKLEERIRRVKKHIENNIIALSLWQMYRVDEVIEAIATHDLPLARGSLMDAHIDVSAYLVHLDVDERETLLLRYHDRKSIVKISEATGLTKYAVRNSIEQGLSRLMRALNLPIVRAVEQEFANYSLTGSVDLGYVYSQAVSIVSNPLQKQSIVDYWSGLLDEELA